MNINPNMEPIQPQTMNSKKCERMVSEHQNAPKKKKTREPSLQLITLTIHEITINKTLRQNKHRQANKHQTR